MLFGSMQVAVLTPSSGVRWAEFAYTCTCVRLQARSPFPSHYGLCLNKLDGASAPASGDDKLLLLLGHGTNLSRNG